MKSEQFYEEYKGIFKYYDYNYERYGMSFSVVVIKLNEELISLDIDFEPIIRYSDKHLKIDKYHHFFLYLGTNIKTAFQAVLNLEKNLLTRYNLYHLDNIFQGAVVSKEKDRNIKDMIQKCFKLIKECEKDKNIITEDDL